MYKSTFAMLLVWFSLGLHPQANSAQSFDLVPLGVYGGGDESNLSAYLLGEAGQQTYICLDAGTLRSGINVAITKGSFQQSNLEVLRNDIKGYFISHGHLDHLAGLIINSPSDSHKPIYGLPSTIHILKNYYFTNHTWSNFANKGDVPRLGTYTYQAHQPGEVFAINHTDLTGQLFQLSHGQHAISSAILVKNKAGEAVLYLGDTGADRIEHSHNLAKLWTAVAPLIKQNKLKAILIEVSFPNSQPDTKLFGHLTPHLLQAELQVLADKVGRKKLTNLKLIITHLKPEAGNIAKIKKELRSYNPLEVTYIFPEQGELIRL